MIIGTGIDLVEVERITDIMQKNNGFREKVFSAGEIAYCESMTHPFQHYAARFAAKEAFLKAIGHGLQAGYDLHHVEVIADALGKPSLKVGGSFNHFLPPDQLVKIHVSFSHLQALVCAVVILES